MNGQRQIYSVSQVNRHIKDLLDGDGVLGGLFVRGELSNYKMYPSGHHYFSMKDGEGALRCVMFRREAMGVRFRPENGMKVIAFGRVSVFPRDGQYQLYVSALTPDGVGDLYVAFEQLKERLRREGLFDPERKKPLPAFPGRIALVTSSAGAAVRDMLRILGARWPMAEVAVVPVRVQGEEAPGEIAAAIDWVNRHALADLIITGRGGGSMEDLWAFNDESVARAIFRSDIPVISAVGHEPDVTIADFVADLRAATPSNAAELAVPDQEEIRARVEQLSLRMRTAAERELRQARAALARWSESRALQDPMNFVADRRVLLDYQRGRLASSLSVSLNREKQRLGRLAAALDAMSPLKVLARGYAVARKADGSVVSSVGAVKAGDRLRLRVSDGEIPCVVEEKP
ncbi:MAG TPA: exodeoxyribonuclease VII large subunit [Candidatus Galloscillospira stercoripullorum]|nr:exodeoxyribonuclease VII large subunit [Candidatus Galloscillospira stercoripullorum]